MKRVTFTFKNGYERKMLVAAADVLTKRGLGTYETRDMANMPQVQKTPADASEIFTPDEELDSAGVSWDPSIHVASKLQNKDGTWRKKPGAASHESDE